MKGEYMEEKLFANQRGMVRGYLTAKELEEYIKRGLGEKYRGCHVTLYDVDWHKWMDRSIDFTYPKKITRILCALIKNATNQKHAIYRLIWTKNHIGNINTNSLFAIKIFEEKKYG